jgi:hypothetical protein
MADAAMIKHLGFMLFGCADFLCFAVGCQFSVSMTPSGIRDDDEARPGSDQWRAGMRQAYRLHMNRDFVGVCFRRAPHIAAPCSELRMMERNYSGRVNRVSR